MYPEEIKDESSESTLVFTLMPLKFPAVAAPIARPDSVIDMAVLSLIAAVPVVMTSWVPVMTEQLPVGGPLPLKETEGVIVVTKKSDGYISVILLPIESAPPAVVVKVNVAKADVLPATRSESAIAKEAFVTAPPITPEAIPEVAI